MVKTLSIGQGGTMKNTVKCRRLLTISLIGLITLFLGCDIGLGTTIDTAVPAVSILTPEVDSVKVGVVEITGLATDETAIKNVQVSLVFNGENKHHYFAEINKETNEWKVVIPTLDDETGEILVEDAKYEIQATAVDTDGKHSTATRSMQVDNTPPTVLVTSPSLFDVNKSTFFRQLRISGSCYDASEISTVKVFFYKHGEESTNYADSTKYAVFEAEGTNTWELTKELSVDDSFFKNDTEYHFFVVAEDAAGNTSSYFYRLGDFYSQGILTDQNPDDEDDYIPFPSMLQIGKLDQGLTVENPTSGLTKKNLDRIKIPSLNIESNNSNFNYRSEAASSVSWGNIEYNEDHSMKAIPLETDITGQIKSTDGTDIIAADVEFWISKLNPLEEWWQVDSSNVKLETAGTTVAFNVKLKKNDVYLKSGTYRIKIKYRTVASQNAALLESNVQEFGISAGMPKLTETNLYKILYDSPLEISPVSLQLFTNESVTLSGLAKKGDGDAADSMVILVNGEEQETPKISEDGDWSFTLAEIGTYNIEIKLNDGGNEVTLNRTVVIYK